MIKYSKQNKNYKHILTVIDFFSKYSWCYPLKTKNSEEIINSFKDIFKRSKRKPTMIQPDEGTEFTNNQTQIFFKNNNIEWYHTINEDIKCSIMNNIINLELNEKYDFKEDKINIIIDVNQYSILIILEKEFTIILDENF